MTHDKNQLLQMCIRDRAGTGVFFRLISIFKFVLHTMEKELFDIFTDA